MPPGYRLTAPAVALALICSLQVLAAPSSPGCNEQRQSLREQLRQARLLGDKPAQNRLTDKLQTLAETCRGVVTVDPRLVEHQRTLEQIERRETLLRKALGTGDAQLIELRRNQLARSRAKLETLP